MDPETLEETQLPPLNVKTGCICPNQGQPIRGLIYIEPACRVHYAEKNIPYAADDEESQKKNWLSGRASIASTAESASPIPK